MNDFVLRGLSGRALVLAAVLCVAGGLLHPVVDGHAHSAEALLSGDEWLGSGLLLAGTALLMLALPVVYSWLAPSLGWIGLTGFVLYFLGNLLSAVPHLVVMAFIGPEIARRAPELISHEDMIVDSHAFATEQVVTGMALVLGLLLLGVGLVRSAQLPRWIGVVAIVGAVVLLVPLPTVPVLGGVQVELARGVVVAALGVLCARSARAVPAPEVVPVG